MGTLYLVATPIGNLEDITARAVRILGTVRLVAAEDTRRAGKLLQYLGVPVPVVSYYEHNKLARQAEILAALEAGDVALISDAGTPALSDPGYELVQAALAAGHTVTPIPGASAVLAALVASGLPTNTFVYLGFVPRSSGARRAWLAALTREPRTLVMFEAPHRLLETLDDIADVLGDRRLAVARELTKLHEEIFRGTVSAARAHFGAGEVRGEITLVVAGATPEECAPHWSAEQVRAELTRLRAGGMKRREAARLVAAMSGWSVRAVYALGEV